MNAGTFKFDSHKSVSHYEWETFIHSTEIAVGWTIDWDQWKGVYNFI